MKPSAFRSFLLVAHHFVVKPPLLAQFCNVYIAYCREYYPQNIGYDKRVHRGNSYAAMVIPAGTSHDTMVMEKRQTQKA